MSHVPSPSAVSSSPLWLPLRKKEKKRREKTDEMEEFISRVKQRAHPSLVRQENLLDSHRYSRPHGSAWRAKNSIVEGKIILARTWSLLEAKLRIEKKRKKDREIIYRKHPLYFSITFLTNSNKDYAHWRVPKYLYVTNMKDFIVKS